MSALQDKINKDRIQAMKDKNAVVKSVTQVVAARFKNVEIELKRPLSDEEAIDIVRKELKQVQDSAADAAKAGRDAAEYTEQASYLESLLPALMTPEQVSAAIAELAAGIEPLNKGTLMKAAMPVLKGKADGKDISAAVDAYLKQ